MTIISPFGPARVPERKSTFNSSNDLSRIRVARFQVFKMLSKQRETRDSNLFT